MDENEEFVRVSAKIEAVLFYKNEPVPKSFLAEHLEVSFEEIETGLEELKNILTNRGVILILGEDAVALGTSPHTSELIEKIRKQERSGPLGKAAIETLSIVLYQGPVSRAEIDYVRGVHSQFILRRLAVRGLIEKIPHPEQKNSYLYQPSIKLLSHLGISNTKDLPEYEKVQRALFEAQSTLNGKEDEGVPSEQELENENLKEREVVKEKEENEAAHDFSEKESFEEDWNIEDDKEKNL